MFDKVDVLYTHLDPAAPTNPEPTQVQESLALLQMQLTNLQRRVAGVQASQQLGHGLHNLSVSVSLSHSPWCYCVQPIASPQHKLLVVASPGLTTIRFSHFFLLFTHAPIPFSHPDSSYTYTGRPTDHHYS